MIRNAAEKVEDRDQVDKRLRIRERFGNHGLGEHGQTPPAANARIVAGSAVAAAPSKR